MRHTLGSLALPLVALSLALAGSTPAGARDWRVPEPWPSEAPRVLLIGDSNIYGPIGDVVMGGLVDHGFAVWRRGRPSTGLSRPDRFDWIAQARAMVDEAKPRAVIVQMGGNDILVLKWRGERRRMIPFWREPEWRDEYARRVRELLTLLADEGRQVFFLSPTNRGIGLDKVMRVREVQRLAAEGVPGVAFVDMFPLTSDDDGAWLRSVVEDGKRVVVRRWDKVHFNEAGGVVIGRRVLAALDAGGLFSSAR